MVWNQSMKQLRRGNLLRASAGLFLSIGFTLFTAAPLHAENLSLEALKRMIDDTAHLTEEVPAKAPDNAAEGESTQTQMSLDMLGALPLSQRVLLDVRSNHSDGAHDMDMLAGLAEKRGINTLVFGEHDRYTIRLGLDPIAGKFGVSQEHPSLYETGLAEFFADLERTRSRYPSLHFMVATESTPGYHWSGTPFVDLTLHNAERHIIALGVERPEQIMALPSYDLRNVKGSFMLSIIFWTIFGLLLLIWLIRKRSRRGALMLAAFYIAVMATWLMQKQVDPDVDFINTAREQGLFTIWTHPGTLSGVRDGPMSVKLNTPPYNERVFEEPTADGFAAVYGDTDSNTVPGGMWDRYMLDYLKGYRGHPIWGVSAGDYHSEGMANEHLGNYPMDVWAKSGDSKTVLQAISAGHSVSWGLSKERNLKMAALFAEDESGNRLLPGDEAFVEPKLNLYAAVSEWVADTAEVKEVLNLSGQWVVDGRVVAVVLLPTNGEVAVTPIELTPGPHVVRLRVPAQKGGRMEANPFLLKVRR